MAILARNHRGFLDAVFAAAKCGAKIVLLNTSFAGPQIREVAQREGTDLLVYDDEYADMLHGVDPPHGRFRAWTDGAEGGGDTLEALIESSFTGTSPKLRVAPKIVLLTSGTTGTPKGAPRDEPRSLSIIGGLLGKVPFRAREVTELCVPMFHALGFALTALGLGLGSTLVVRRHFDPEQTLASLEGNQVTALIVVPVMLARIHRPRPRQDRRARPVGAEDHLHRRLAARRRAGQTGASSVRFGALQPLWLYRDRLRDDRHSRRSGAGAGLRGRGRARNDRQDPRFGWRGGARR